jgi:quercetin dioxygenase-like cupin family protein
MKHPKITIGCVANLWSRMMQFEKAGDTEQGHTHPFDHLTLLASGKLQVTTDNNVTVFKAPHMIYIHKDKKHELVALEDNTVAYCIHALRDGNGVDDILDPSMIPKGVKPTSLSEPVVCS